MNSKVARIVTGGWGVERDLSQLLDWPDQWAKLLSRSGAAGREESTTKYLRSGKLATIKGDTLMKSRSQESCAPADPARAHARRRVGGKGMDERDAYIPG